MFFNPAGPEKLTRSCKSIERQVMRMACRFGFFEDFATQRR